jgi:membrane protein required for colicin V production
LNVESISMLDWIVLVVIVFSTLISIKRGFVKEALSLATLIAAMVISRLFGPQVSTLLIDHIEVASLRNVAAYMSLFVATLVTGGLINTLIVQMVHLAGLSGFDRLLGMLFGFARGLLVVVIAIAVLARVGVTEDQWWKDSQLIPVFVAMGDWIQMIGRDSADAVIQKVRAS